MLLMTRKRRVIRSLVGFLSYMIPPRQAIKIDPSYTKAHARLATAQDVRFLQQKDSIPELSHNSFLANAGTVSRAGKMH